MIVILTQGGPGDATRSLSILIVEEGFGSFQIGYAASISVVMTVIILIITAVQQFAVAPLGAALNGGDADHAPAKRWIDRAIIAVMIAARHRHAAAVPAGCSRCRSGRSPTPTSCRRASCRRASTSPTTAPVLASRVPFLQIYWNSLLIAVVVTVGQLVTCTLAAFAFARLNFRGRDALFFILLVGLMFPAQVTILPIYLGYAQVGLINQPIGLALMYLTSSFGVFLDPPVHAEPAQGAGGGGADGRRRLLQDLLAHLAAAAPARRSRRSASSPSPRPGTTTSRRACCSARSSR